MSLNTGNGTNVSLDMKPWALRHLSEALTAHPRPYSFLLSYVLGVMGFTLLVALRLLLQLAHLLPSHGILCFTLTEARIMSAEIIIFSLVSLGGERLICVLSIRVRCGLAVSKLFARLRQGALCMGLKSGMVIGGFWLWSGILFSVSLREDISSHDQDDEYICIWNSPAVSNRWLKLAVRLPACIGGVVAMRRAKAELRQTIIITDLVSSVLTLALGSYVLVLVFFFAPLTLLKSWRVVSFVDSWSLAYLEGVFLILVYAVPIIGSASFLLYNNMRKCTLHTA